MTETARRGPPRSYPRPVAGAVLGGNYRVVEVLGRPHPRRKDLFVRVACVDCGRVADMPEYKARKGHVGSVGQHCPSRAPDVPEESLFVAVRRLVGHVDPRPLYERALEARRLEIEAARRRVA